ncbi:short coiled-coil protein [Reichenbachiella ulvae]|uniref:Short coiled-coil protein n=1 Tax=Reichenbachiella ulvae TaxID=2980104 RepID=A0ABT3CPI8_9BACT|nr:short coiled-coil protein [Reichenbachiella ulvae]MCV9385646.1 short coiled-coil protein [Reichenbachiella ulvae]
MKEEKFTFEKKVLLGICVIALWRSAFSIYQLYAGEIDEYNLIGQILLFLVYSGTIAFLLIKGYRPFLGVVFGVLFTVFNAFLWIHNGGLERLADESMIAALLVAAVLNQNRSMKWMVGFVLFVQVLLLYLWEFQFDLIASWVGTLGYQVLRYQVVLVLVTFGMIYFAFQYDVDRKKQWSRKAQLHETMAEIRKENIKLEQQEKELNKLNALLERKVKERREELRKQNQSIEQYIELSSSKISPSLNAITTYIAKSQFYSSYGELLKRSGSNLVKSFIKIQNKADT